MLTCILCFYVELIANQNKTKLVSTLLFTQKMFTNNNHACKVHQFNYKATLIPLPNITILYNTMLSQKIVAI